MIEKIELKLNFLKRILTDTVEENIYENFFNFGYPDDSIMLNCINSPVNSNREEGLDWPARAHTMIGLKRLNNLHNMLSVVKNNKIFGDFVETGVWRGGATIFIQAYNKMYELKKNVFVCDSFEGLPEPNIIKYPQDLGDTHYQESFLKVSLEIVKSNFQLYNLLDENVIFIKGWFSETLKDNRDIKNISMLRFDGDMYGSTMDVLNNLYQKISSGGVLIVDDYCLPNCKKAVEDFRIIKNIANKIEKIDKCGIFWFI